MLYTINNILSTLARQGYGLDDAYNGSWRIVDSAKAVAIGILGIVVVAFIIGIFFTIHDSGRSYGDKDIKNEEYLNKHKKRNKDTDKE